MSAEMRAERHRGSQACIPAFSRFWSSKPSGARRRSTVTNRCSQGLSLRSFSFEMAAFLYKCVSDTAFEGSGELPLDVLDKLEANHLRSFSARSPLVLRPISSHLRSFSARSPLVLRSFSCPASPHPPLAAPSPPSNVNFCSNVLQHPFYHFLFSIFEKR